DIRAPSMAGACSPRRRRARLDHDPRRPLATSASQAVNPVVRQNVRPSVLSASHSVHPVGVRQHVEAHQSKDKEHNHRAHDPHDAHFGFLSVLFILVWHPFLLNYGSTVCPHFFDFPPSQNLRKLYSFLLTSALRQLTSN